MVPPEWLYSVRMGICVPCDVKQRARGRGAVKEDTQTAGCGQCKGLVTLIQPGYVAEGVALSGTNGSHLGRVL